MTIEDLCGYLQISESEIRRLVKEQEIPFHDRLGSPRFLEAEIDQWMMAGTEGSEQISDDDTAFVYRGRPIKEYMLTGSMILQVQSAWERLPAFVMDAVKACDKTGRSYLFREDLAPLMSNFNDYLRVSFQLGLIDSERHGRRTHYTPTEYARKICEEGNDKKVRQIILDSIMNLVRRNLETFPQERHVIFLLWHFLKIRQRGEEPNESHFRKPGEDTAYPAIRLGVAKSLCDYLFDGDSSRIQAYLEVWNRHMTAVEDVEPAPPALNSGLDD
jgi:excisionase family DNA binding protein